MESLNNKTEIELNNLFNKLRDEHESKKEEIESLTYKLDEIVKSIEESEKELILIEKNYTNLVKFIYNRKNV